MDNGLKLIIGLGNPGDRYSLTRHNAGYWFLDRLAEAAGAIFQTESKLRATACEIQVGGRCIRLLKPLTFMNHSGQAASATARYYGVPFDKIMIVHDELDLPAGRVRMKFDGGHGGHNGLRDIMTALGSSAFWRLRIGIGHPGDRRDVVDYVLGRPAKSDAEVISAAISCAAESVHDLVGGRFQSVMRKLNARE